MFRAKSSRMEELFMAGRMILIHLLQEYAYTLYSTAIYCISNHIK